MSKEFWITNSRFKYIGLILFLMFLAFMIFFYLKADEITKDPCSICAERLGKDIHCTTGGLTPITKTYGFDGSEYVDISNLPSNALPSLELNK